MNKLYFVLVFLFVSGISANAQFKLNTKKLTEAAQKTVEALTRTDGQMAAYTQEYIDWSDANNPICSVTDKNKKSKAVALRLEKIVASIPQIDGHSFDIKAYHVIDQNAFACANGSIRIFAGLMEIMTDDQILGVIGHEMGHIVNSDTKDAFKRALLTSALKDAVASTDKKVEKLTNSQLGKLGEMLSKSQFSQKQEYEADDFGYEILKKSGRDPQAMASGLRVIQGLQDAAASKPDAINQLLSSHPESAKRAAKLDEKHQKGGGTVATTAKGGKTNNSKTSDAWKF